MSDEVATQDEVETVYWLPKDWNAKRYELFREVITHEDNLVNHRLSWMIMSETFLMLGYLTSSLVEGRYKHIAGIALAAFGIMTSLVIYPTILLATANIKKQRDRYYNLKKKKDDDVDQDQGLIPDLVFNGDGHDEECCVCPCKAIDACKEMIYKDFLENVKSKKCKCECGMYVSCCLPLLLVALWCILLYYEVQSYSEYKDRQPSPNQTQVVLLDAAVDTRTCLYTNKFLQCRSSMGHTYEEASSQNRNPVSLYVKASFEDSGQPVSGLPFTDFTVQARNSDYGFIACPISTCGSAFKEIESGIYHLFLVHNEAKDNWIAGEYKGRLEVESQEGSLENVDFDFNIPLPAQLRAQFTHSLGIDTISCAYEIDRYAEGCSGDGHTHDVASADNRNPVRIHLSICSIGCFDGNPEGANIETSDVLIESIFPRDNVFKIWSVQDDVEATTKAGAYDIYIHPQTERWEEGVHHGRLLVTKNTGILGWIFSFTIPKHSPLPLILERWSQNPISVSTTNNSPIELTFTVSWFEGNAVKGLSTLDDQTFYLSTLEAPIAEPFYDCNALACFEGKDEIYEGVYRMSLRPREAKNWRGGDYKIQITIVEPNSGAKGIVTFDFSAV